MQDFNNMPEKGGKYQFSSDELEEILREAREEREAEARAVAAAEHKSVEASKQTAAPKQASAPKQAEAVPKAPAQEPRRKAAPVPPVPTVSEPTVRFKPAAQAEAAPAAKPRLLKGWHKVLLSFAGVILLLSLAVFGVAKIFIKPPENQGQGIGEDAVPGIEAQVDDIEKNDGKHKTDIIYAFTDDTSSKPVKPTEDVVDVYTEEPKSINQNVYNILLAGFDEIEGSVHTDTIMVLSYNAEKQAISIVSVPRDTCCNVSWTATKKINSAYAIGGMSKLSSELKKIMGFECDYYVLVEMSAMAALVDAIGGVEYDVPYRMHYSDPSQNLYIDIYQGKQTLNGKQAVQLCRWRQNNDGVRGGLNGDLGRIELQHDFLVALAKQCISIKNIAANVADYAKIFHDYVDTNLSLGELAWFGLRFKDVGLDNIETYTLEGYADMLGNVSYYFLYPGKVAALMDEHFNPYVDHKITTADLNIYVKGSSFSGGGSGTGSGSGTTHVTPSVPSDPGTPDDPGVQPYDPGNPIDPNDPNIDPEPVDPGTSDPGSYDPGTSDPGTSDPGTSDPGTSDPGTSDPGTPDEPPTPPVEPPAPVDPPADDGGFFSDPTE